MYRNIYVALFSFIHYRVSNQAWKICPKKFTSKNRKVDNKMRATKSLQQMQALWSDETGATLGEYALVVVFIGLAGMVINTVLPGAIRIYVRKIYRVVSSPLP